MGHASTGEASGDVCTLWPMSWPSYNVDKICEIAHHRPREGSKDEAQAKHDGMQVGGIITWYQGGASILYM